MLRATIPVAVLLLPLLGCAATQDAPPRAPVEPAVTAAPERLTERLPPLPLRRVDASPELQRGLALAEDVFRQPGARFDGTDQEAFQVWMQRDFTDWMGSMAKRIEEAQTALEAVTDDRRESVIAAAVVAACYGHFIELLLATPVPPVLRNDAELVAIFHQGLEQAAAPWMQKAEDAFAYCHITAGHDPRPTRHHLRLHERRQAHQPPRHRLPPPRGVSVEVRHTLPHGDSSEQHHPPPATRIVEVRSGASAPAGPHRRRSSATSRIGPRT